MSTKAVLKEFKKNLGPIETKVLPGNIHVNRRWYKGKLGEIELCVMTYYSDGQTQYNVGIYCDGADPEKYLWIEPKIKDIIAEMKVEFTSEEILLHLANKVAFYTSLEKTVNEKMS